MSNYLEEFAETLKPAFDVSMDPFCLVNRSGVIVCLNTAMRKLLRLSPREVSRGPVFCDRIALSICSGGCQISHAMDNDEIVQYDPVPAIGGDEKLRVMLKIVPLKDEGKKTVGALISMRDATGEILLQAKFHKTLQIIEEHESKIESLETKIQSLRDGLRGVSSNSRG